MGMSKFTFNTDYVDYITFYTSKRRGLDRERSCSTESLAGVVKYGGLTFKICTVHGTTYPKIGIRNR